jgi:hypothetical protein
MDPGQAFKYFKVARALRRSADDLCEVAEEGDAYGNAVAIVAIHAAIAYADTLCIAFGGFKSVGGDHGRAVEALVAALGSRSDPGKVKTLQEILSEKDAVSYQGVYYAVSDARAMVDRLTAFAEWAEELYERRP